MTLILRTSKWQVKNESPKLLKEQRYDNELLGEDYRTPEWGVVGEYATMVT